MAPKKPETPEDDAPAEETPAPKKGFPLVGILAIVLLLAAGAAGAVVAAGMLSASPEQPGKPGAAAADSNAEVKKQDAIVFRIDQPVIVNVYQTRQRRFLSVKPIFELRDAKTLKLIESKQAQLRHVVLSVLKNKTLEELDAPEVVNTLGREIAAAVNLQLGLDSGIKQVYFTEFVVQ